MRKRLYEILTHPAHDDVVGRIVNGLMLALIAANVAASVLETDADIQSLAPRFFEQFEVVSVAIFSIEYVVRLWACTADPKFKGPIAGRIKHALLLMSLVDIAAIAPFYIELLLPSVIDLRFLRVMRLVRLFRLGRASKLAEALAMLARVIRSKRIELGVSLSLVAIATLLAAGAMWVAERTIPGTQFTSIPRAMWWSVETITTVGYGDMVPQSPVGRVIGSVVAFLGVCTFALPVGILSSGFISELERQKKAAEGTLESCPHCGEPLE